jgi:Protein of unknown function (DUF2949)
VYKQPFIEYLQKELGISEAAIAIVTRTQQLNETQLPIMLWQFGLITLQQLSHIFDWMDNRAI